MAALALQRFSFANAAKFDVLPALAKEISIAPVKLTSFIEHLAETLANRSDLVFTQWRTFKSMCRKAAKSTICEFDDPLILLLRRTSAMQSATAEAR